MGIHRFSGSKSDIVGGEHFILQRCLLFQHWEKRNAAIGIILPGARLILSFAETEHGVGVLIISILKSFDFFAHKADTEAQGG